MGNNAHIKFWNFHFKLDSGADVNVVRLQVYRQIAKNQSSETTDKVLMVRVIIH